MIVCVAVTGQPLTVAVKVTTKEPPVAGAVNVVPLTPVPLHTILVTVVPVGNPAASVAVAPGHNGPIGANTGVGTEIAVKAMIVDVTGAQPGILALTV